MNYSKKLNHGEAVILGIYSALKFSLKNKILKKIDFNLIVSHFEKASLSYNVKKLFRRKMLIK